MNLGNDLDNLIAESIKHGIAKVVGSEFAKTRGQLDDMAADIAKKYNKVLRQKSEFLAVVNKGSY